MTFYLVEMFDHQTSEDYIVIDAAIRFEDAVERMNGHIFCLTKGEFSAWDSIGDGDYNYLNERKPDGREYEFQIREVSFH